MTFRHLEERVIGNSVEKDYLDLFVDDKLREPTRTVLGYTLDIAALLEESGLQDEYVLFGGYAVLTHLMSTLGERFSLVWRGSEDIDMYGTERVVQMLKGHYAVQSDLASPNVPNKRTIKLTTQGDKPEGEVKVDYIMDQGIYMPIERKIFMTKISVADPVSLIRSKVQLAAARENNPESLKQKIDVTNLLWVAEHDNIAPEQIYFRLEKNEKIALRGAIANSRDLVSNKRKTFAPTRQYVNEILGGIKHIK